MAWPKYWMTGQVDLCIMQFNKAFDVRPHQHLLAILDHLGLRGITKQRIEGFLIGRHQKVVIL